MFFFQSASWKRHCVTHWREQRGMDSYLPRQISQSDCKISSNCGKKHYTPFKQLGPVRYLQAWPRSLTRVHRETTAPTSGQNGTSTCNLAASCLLLVPTFTAVPSAANQIIQMYVWTTNLLPKKVACPKFPQVECHKESSQNHDCGKKSSVWLSLHYHFGRLPWCWICFL